VAHLKTGKKNEVLKSQVIAGWGYSFVKQSNFKFAPGRLESN
jgi:hypothetical protein